MKALTILITGGIGSGKSAVSRHLAGNGVPVYDSDSRTKALYDGTLGEVLERELGVHLHDVDGKFDRKALAALIFNDSRSLERVEAIVHPAVLEDFIRWREKMIPLSGWNGYAGMDPFVCMESAIAMDKPLFDGSYDISVLVDAREDIRVARASLRDSASEEAIRCRIRNQHLDASRADYVIENNGSREELAIAVDGVFRRMAVELAAANS